MIDYNHGKMGIRNLFHIKGSVLQKTLVWSLPASLLAAVLHKFVFEHNPDDGTKNVSNVVSSINGSFTYVLGFLVVFRTQQAYSRYWEGVSLIQQTRGQWFNATASLVAFCTENQEKKQKVLQFQHLLVRLVSILHCTALQQIAEISDEEWRTIDRSGIDIPSMSYLATKSDKCEIIFLWIQRLIGENMANGVVVAAPPIVSRVFQDLSLGIVNINSAKKINEIPFPFPYAQMVVWMLIIFTIVTPLGLAQYAGHYYHAAIMSFLIITIYWAINFIAVELEMPFGSDENDLPMLEFQNRMNMSLKSLLDEHAQIPPMFDLEKMSPVTVESPMCWNSDDIISPPGVSASENSPEFKRWSVALQSRKQNMVVQHTDVLANSAKLLQTLPSAFAVTASQAVSKTLNIPRSLVDTTSNVAPEPHIQGDQVNIEVEQPPCQRPRSWEAGMIACNREMADHLEKVEQDVAILVEFGRRLTMKGAESREESGLPEVDLSNYDFSVLQSAISSHPGFPGKISQM